MNVYRTHSFTFTEIMVATVILALAAAATMGIVGGAQAAVFHAERRWNHQHITANVTEFYLLAGPHAMPADDLMPPGYSSSCELLEVDDLHEEALQPNKQWRLGEYVIRVYDDRGQQISETRIRKMLKEKDFS